MTVERPLAAMAGTAFTTLLVLMLQLSASGAAAPLS